MGGVFFDYTPGRIDARFRHAAMSGMIVLQIRMSEALITTTQSDENGKLGEPVNHYQRAVDESMFIWATFCPFGDYIRFLEAVALQVQECAFEWEAEGPEGRLEWRRRFIDDTGFLTLKWDGTFRGYSHKFSHRMMLNTRQMVRMLYSAFRRFVESPEYQPMRYEKMKIEETFSSVIKNATLDDLVKVVVDCSAQRAESLIYAIRDAVAECLHYGARASYPLQYYIENSVAPVDLDDFNSWIDKRWDSWDLVRRASYLRETLFPWSDPIYWDGANLRGMRSKLIEEWLASPEPPRKSPFGIPHRVEDEEETT
jgi:hypothetical protein